MSEVEIKHIHTFYTHSSQKPSTCLNEIIKKYIHKRNIFKTINVMFNEYEFLFF